MTQQQAPYGSWQSSINAEMVAGKSPRISDTYIQQDRIFWCESIASEKGRNAIMMHDGEQLQCILPKPLSAKSRVHEYGGAPYTIYGNTLFFVLAEDQRIYRSEIGQKEFCPSAITPEENKRYADLQYDAHNDRIIAVCEEHTGDHHSQVRNYLVAIPSDGNGQIQRLSEGHDFYANPRLSPDGRTLTWITWDHPNMPWDNTQLWLADIDNKGLSNIRTIAGNGNESIAQPQWSNQGDLYFVSDRSQWWNIYTINKEDLSQAQPDAYCVLEQQAEFATPQWVFGMSTYSFLDDDTIFATCTSNGTWQLLSITLNRTENKILKNHVAENVAKNAGTVDTINTPCTNIQALSAANGKGIFIGASPSKENSLYCYLNDEDNKVITELTPSDSSINSDEFSLPQPITFETTEGQHAHALFYPPHNTAYGQSTNEGTLPPLIVICHGGPTGATESSLNLKIQYWTNRGFAVADVNYRGSTGYGRDFRHHLQNQWGVYDVDDVCKVVSHLADKNLIDKSRCVIKGSSAGGYTVLAALAFRDVFSAGVSLYGIGDLEMLAKDTHKFEARYLDGLIGRYPEEQAIYKERSPINSIDKITCPLLIFQGLMDKVVPPNQAEDMFNAVKSKNIPVAYVTYPDEAHGFRNPETIEHMLNSELQFYSKLFNFPLDITTQETLHITNLVQN